MTPFPVRSAALTLALGAGVAMVDAPWSQFPELGSLLIIGLLSFQPRTQRIAAPLLVLLLTCWLGLTTLWSLNPTGTVKALIRTGLLLAAAAMLTSTRRHRDVVIPLALGTSILCLLALLWLALFPAVATSPDGLKGMMPQNNSMAYVAAVALISALFAQELPRPLRIALILLDTLTLVLTLSMTSWLAVIAATLTASMVIGLRRFSLRLRAAIGLLLAGVMATLGYLLVFVPVATLVGRDATLTGRTDIWPEILQIANQRWLTGWGHGAPWLPGSWIREWCQYHFTFHMISAHNALLETYLQLGLVGVSLVCLLWAAGLLRIIGAVWRSGRGGWLLALALFQLIHGMAEATQLAPLGWLIAGLVWLSPSAATMPLGGPARPPAPLRRKLV